MKLAFVIQRYGREIPGGAETLARQIAERQARRHQIDVLTTTARDYVTWKNEYPESEEKLRGVKIFRFPVEQQRNLEEFNKYSDWIYANEHTREDELKWLEMQGPVAPKLIEYLKNEHKKYDLLVFFTYLYYPTYYGIQIAPEKSVLVPTAHDEPPLKLGIYKEVFEKASSFIFNAEAEELLVLERFDVHRKMRETIGMGMELLDAPDTEPFRRKQRVSNRFLLYAGRIDEGKGCGELIKFFTTFREEHLDIGNLQLVLIGKKNMSIPHSRDIRYLGFLPEDEKLAAMASATAVMVPSRLESLSIVALEAFSVGAPVVVHGGSKVLVDHCRKANAGLYYRNYEEFEGILEALLEDKDLASGLGRQGQRYIKENFGWEKLLPLYDLAFRSSARQQRPPAPEPRPERRPDRHRDRDRGWRDLESRERRPYKRPEVREQPAESAEEPQPQTEGTPAAGVAEVTAAALESLTPSPEDSPDEPAAIAEGAAIETAPSPAETLAIEQEPVTPTSEEATAQEPQPEPRPEPRDDEEPELEPADVETAEYDKREPEPALESAMESEEPELRPADVDTSEYDKPEPEPALEPQEPEAKESEQEEEPEEKGSQPKDNTS